MTPDDGRGSFHCAAKPLPRPGLCARLCPEGVEREHGTGTKKGGGKIHPNTSIIAQAPFPVNTKWAWDRENLCSAQNQMCAFGEHSVLKSSKFHVIL